MLASDRCKPSPPGQAPPLLHGRDNAWDRLEISSGNRPNKVMLLSCMLCAMLGLVRVHVHAAGVSFTAQSRGRLSPLKVWKRVQARGGLRGPSCAIPRAGRESAGKTTESEVAGGKTRVSPFMTWPPAKQTLPQHICAPHCEEGSAGLNVAATAWSSMLPVFVCSRLLDTCLPGCPV